MTQDKSKAIPRRSFLQSLLALPAFLLFRNVPIADPDEIIEVDGWLLKRSDLL
jgi:hypothetical protein